MAYYLNMHTVVETPMYLKAAEEIFDHVEMENIVSEIAANPTIGDVMPRTGGYRKVRFGRTGMGKRGGARVIYLYLGEDMPVVLVTAYAKADKGKLTSVEEKQLVKAASTYRDAFRGNR